MKPPFDIPCVILCGGRSSRMGEDKSLLPFGASNSLVQYQYERLKPYFKNVYLSSKENKFDFLKSDENIIYDKGEVYSPMIALKSILEFCQDSFVFIITVDTPFVKISTIEKILNEKSGFEITLAETKRLHNLCGVYSKTSLEKIDEALAQDIHKIGFVVKNSKTKIISFKDEDEFINLNISSDYNYAKSIISKYNNNY